VVVRYLVHRVLKELAELWKTALEEKSLVGSAFRSLLLLLVELRHKRRVRAAQHGRSGRSCLARIGVKVVSRRKHVGNLEPLAFTSASAKG